MCLQFISSFKNVLGVFLRLFGSGVNVFLGSYGVVLEEVIRALKIEYFW